MCHVYFHITELTCVPLAVLSLSVSSSSAPSVAALLCSGSDWGHCSCAAGQVESRELEHSIPSTAVSTIYMA